MLENGGTAVAWAQPEDQDLCTGRPIALLKSHRHHHPTDCTQASRIPPSQESGGRLLSSHHQCTGKTSKPHEPKKSKEFTRAPRSDPHFHDFDGACLWTSITQKKRTRLPNIDPKFTAEPWLEQLKFGSNGVRFETCCYKSGDSTQAYVRAVQGD